MILENKCAICNEKITERAHFFKKHKIKESDYYLKYFPRFDLFSNEKISFISPEQYFNTDFIGKINFRKYLESISKENGINYLLSWLKKRKEKKNLIYSPSHFELRTLCYPSVKYIDGYYGIGTYKTICEQLGLINRYEYNIKLEYSNIERSIIIDTRENEVLKFDGQKEIKKLDFADYSADINPFNAYIERKSLEDFIGSFSSGFDRLNREMQRAKDKNAHIIIMVESKIDNLLSFNRLKYLRTKASVDFILKRTRDLLLNHDNVQICCVDGRERASEFVEKVFRLETDPKKIDFQFMIDSKLLFRK